MNTAWRKMLVFKRISEISDNKKKTKIVPKKLNVNIKNKMIFNQLASVLSKNTAYTQLYIKLFEDMDRFNFAETSSVPDAEYFDLIASDFKHINLLKHTIGVFDRMSAILESAHSLKISDKADVLLVIALLHDFGKSEVLCKSYDIGLRDKHWIRSAKYFLQIVKTEDIEIDEVTKNTIFETLRLHHSPILSQQQQENLFLQLLKQADSEARYKELKKDI